jgi:serine/threonine-protein kinase
MVAQGTTLAGRYRLDDRLGAGGMGEVWRGEDVVLARTVAVKLLLPERMDDPGFAVRFQGEARAMATINHPGVVDVYDYGVTEVPGDGPTAFLVMRFVDGEPLDRLLTRLGHIGAEPAMELIAQAAAAMQAVHDRGIVHRDIKPGNLLVRSDGTLVLTDFGIARSEAANRLTDVGMVLGTAAYCAPEQAEGAPVTPAVDIYALGVVAYECLAGQRPFDGESPVTIALKHIREAPPPLPAHLPPAVRHVVERALAKDPGSRWPSAAALSVAARQAAMLPGETPAPVAVPEPSPGPGDPPPYALPYPSSSYGTHAEAVPDAETVMRAAREPGGHRAAPQRKRRRTGLFAGVAVGAALFGGVVAVGINSMAASGNEQTLPTVAGTSTDSTSGPLTVETGSPVPTKPKPPKARVSTPPAHPVSRPPSPSHSPSPSPSASKSHSPSPSPSKTLLMKKVPAVEGLSEAEAVAAIKEAGLTAKVIVSDDPDTGSCSVVLRQSPTVGSPLAQGKPVSITVDRATACPGQSASPSPSSTS